MLCSNLAIRQLGNAVRASSAMPSPTSQPGGGLSLMQHRTNVWAPASRALRWRVASMARHCSGGLLHQPVERRVVVDVVPERQFDQVEIQRGRAIPRLRCDSVGAPGDVGEQTRMGSPHAEEIIAAVVAGPDHRAPLAAGEEKCGRCDQGGGRERRRVGTQHAGGGVAAIEQRPDRMQEAAAKPLHARWGRHGPVRQDRDVPGARCGVSASSVPAGA